MDSSLPQVGHQYHSTAETAGTASHLIHEVTKVVVNHHIELTEEEKAGQRAIALKRYQEEEMRKLQQRNSRPKAAKQTA